MYSGVSIVEIPYAFMALENARLPYRVQGAVIVKKQQFSPEEWTTLSAALIHADVHHRSGAIAVQSAHGHRLRQS